ncbi:MAG TPA: marine proteobacterial sortase target protein [Woeseiaceae bacterium]|nr:marine proteobacterial sortase target protein [Woeseiaceae bacterium]
MTSTPFATSDRNNRLAPFGWLTALMFACTFALLLASNPGRAEGALPETVQAGSLLLRMATGYQVATAVDTDVDMQINGLVARVSVRQSFLNTGADWAEGVYVFPLPEQAAVDHMRLHIGERFIEGEIREKEAARQEYEAARAAGKRASLVEQQRPNLFTTAVANIAPGETVIVEIEYLEDLRYEDGKFSLRFPMTLTPRYMPGTSLPDRQGNGWSADTSQVADASLISPPMVARAKDQNASLHISLNAGMPLDIIASRYHPITVKEQSGRYDIQLKSPSVPLDHDFELVWRPIIGSEPQAMVFTETVNDVPYYLLMVMPPAGEPDASYAMPREMIFIIDTSGSMHGTSIAQAKRALQRALQGLRATDEFNVIAFSSDSVPLFRQSMPVDARSLSLAEQFVAGLEAEGGTEMRGALELALHKLPDESHLRQVIFITDGAVGNEEELFSLIGERLGQGRLFTIGIGSAPNSWFMRKAAEVGRGSFTMISALNEVGEKMDRLFEKIEQPQVTNITVDWPGGVIAQSYPSVVPDLYAGEPVLVKARIGGPIDGAGTIRISGNTLHGAWQHELSLSSAGSEQHSGEQSEREQSIGVAALWARARIADLLDAGRRGRDADEVRGAVTATALAHHLVSQYTSLVAVDKTPARASSDPLRRDQVANRMAWGQSAEAIFGFPATATNARELLTTGFAWLLAAFMLMLVTTPRRSSRHVLVA